MGEEFDEHLEGSVAPALHHAELRRHGLPPLAYRKLGSAWAALRFWPACQHRLGV